MPIVISEGKTPKGRRCLRAHVTGHVSAEEAEAMRKQLVPGAPFHGVLCYCEVEKGVEYAAGARRIFSDFDGLYIAMGTKVTSPVVRAAINFMLRIRKELDYNRMFVTEEEAMAWLDAQAEQRGK